MATQRFGQSYKQKVYLLLGGALVFAVIAWQLGFANTIQQYREKSRTEAKLQQAANVVQEINFFEQKLQAFQQDSTHIKFSQENLFEVVTEWCEAHRLEVRAMPEAELVEENGYQIYMNHIELEGPYIEMVQLMYLLEQEYKMGQLVHSHFELVKNRDTRQMELVAQLHLHNIQSIADEK